MKEMTELEQGILEAAKQGVSSAVKQELVGYGKPLTKVVESVVAENVGRLRDICREAISSAINSDDFKQAVLGAFNHKLAKVMVGQLEGGIEKAANALKNDPSMKARMVLAIETIIDSVKN